MLYVALVALCAAAFAPAALSQTFPSRVVRVIVPYPPGGGATELIIRLIAPKMSEALGQPVIIDNRAGANGFIGSEMVARAAPDGHTLLYASSSTMANGIYLSKNVPFDPVRDFTPIGLAGTPITTFAVNPSLPVSTVKELIDYARRNPGKLTFGSSGIGSMHHLTGEAFKRVTGTDMLHVPYKGTAQAFNDVVAGRIDIFFAGTTLVRPLLGGGKIKVIGMLESQRYAGLANIPTVSETLPGFTKAPSWFAVFGPPALPVPIVSRLNDELAKALRHPDVAARLDEVGIQPLPGTPAQLAATLRDDIERAGRLMKELGIQPE
jgi:tripartite-type tricarboxylate transporter receptor subunit TctC